VGLVWGSQTCFSGISGWLPRSVVLNLDWVEGTESFVLRQEVFFNRERMGTRFKGFPDSMGCRTLMLWLDLNLHEHR
jgi:hypothetical protein